MDIFRVLSLMRIVLEVFPVNGVDVLVPWLEKDPSHVRVKESSCRRITLGCGETNVPL